MFILSRAQNEHESNCLCGQTWPNKDYADSDILKDFSIKYCFFFLFFLLFFADWLHHIHLNYDKSIMPQQAKSKEKNYWC